LNQERANPGTPKREPITSRRSQPTSTRVCIGYHMQSSLARYQCYSDVILW
jgi:hypothetical protein